MLVSFFNTETTFVFFHPAAILIFAGTMVAKMVTPVPVVLVLLLLYAKCEDGAQEAGLLALAPLLLLGLNLQGL